MHNSNLPLALTMGDPAGIGPEIIVKSINKLKMNNYVVFGDAMVFENIIDLEIQFLEPLNRMNLKNIMEDFCHCYLFSILTLDHKLYMR